jgi:hypothetical protein
MLIQNTYINWLHFIVRASDEERAVQFKPPQKKVTLKSLSEEVDKLRDP